MHDVWSCIEPRLQSKRTSPPNSIVFSGNTFDVVGCGGVGLSTAYGSVGTDEERSR